MAEGSKSQQLTYRQEMFCQEYIANGGNGTQAAIHAGYSEDSARTLACDTLAKPYIAARIEQLSAERLARLQITGDKLVAKMAALAFGNIQDCYDAETGELIPPHKLPRHVAASVTEVTERWAGDIREIKYKLADRKGPLETLMKEAGMLIDRKEEIPPGTIEWESDYMRSLAAAADKGGDGGE